MSELEIQQVSGQFLELDADPETRRLRISLSQTAVLYKDQTQIFGDERFVELDEEGRWQTELADTDNMSDGAFYFFELEINGKIYQKYVPVAVHCHDFNDLPDVIFSEP